MKFFEGWLDGLHHYAIILPYGLNVKEEYTLEVYFLDDMGHRHPVYNRLLKSVSACEKALRDHYQETEWKEI